MKRTIIFFVSVVAMLLASCDSDVTFLDKADKTFTGNLLLNDVIISHDVKCEVKINAVEGVVTIYGTERQNIVPLEGMRIEGLVPVSQRYGFLLSGADIEPLVGEKPFSALKMSLVEGCLDGSKFVIDMQVPEGTLTFTNAVSDVYVGKLSVDDYERTAKISIKEDVFASTIEIFFDNVKFAALMFTTVDIILKDIPCSNVYDLQFSAKNVVPYMNKEPDPKPAYKFAEIRGGVMDGRLWLFAKMADNLKPSRAGKEFSFIGEKED